MSIPQRGQTTLLRPPMENIQSLGSQLVHVITDKYVRTDLDGDGPLCVGADRQARNAQIRSLLLDPAGVCDNYSGMTLQGEEFQVGHRIHDLDPVSLQTKLPNRLTCTWMHRKDHTQILTEGKQRSQNRS